MPTSERDGPARRADANVTGYPGNDSDRTGDTGRMPVLHTQTRSIRIGFVLFGIGLLFLLVTVLPFFWGSHNRMVWLNVGCMLAPVGFVIAVTGAVRTGRAEQRAADAAVKRTWHTDHSGISPVERAVDGKLDHATDQLGRSVPRAPG